VNRARWPLTARSRPPPAFAALRAGICSHPAQLAGQFMVVPDGTMVSVAAGYGMIMTVIIPFPSGDISSAKGKPAIRSDPAANARPKTNDSRHDH